MRQLAQDIATGEISIVDVPPPHAGPTSLLVATRHSLLGAFAERGAGAADREGGVARPDPEAGGRLGGLAGVVLRDCDGAPAAPGELVAGGVAGGVSHAEIVACRATLCAVVPESVPPEVAAYAAVASIALHGVRRVEVGVGDVAAVVGLGLVGQLALELLDAGGCAVIGLDRDEGRAELARQGGFRATSDEGAFRREVARLTGGRGADGTLVAAASRAAPTLTTAAAVARERSVVCVVGDVSVESPPALRGGTAGRRVALAGPLIRGSGASRAHPATCAGRSGATSRRCCA